jgi:hypothetical protein
VLPNFSSSVAQSPEAATLSQLLQISASYRAALPNVQSVQTVNVTKSFALGSIIPLRRVQSFVMAMPNLRLYGSLIEFTVRTAVSPQISL